MCPGRARSEAWDVGAAATSIVLARSAALIPVETPGVASIEHGGAGRDRFRALAEIRGGFWRGILGRAGLRPDRYRCGSAAISAQLLPLGVGLTRAEHLVISPALARRGQGES